MDHLSNLNPSGKCAVPPEYPVCHGIVFVGFPAEIYSPPLGVQVPH